MPPAFSTNNQESDPMEYRILGRTGVTVSNLCLGAMMFGPWGDPDHAWLTRNVAYAQGELHLYGLTNQAPGLFGGENAVIRADGGGVGPSASFEKDIPEYDDEAADLDLDDLL
jgi:hypothetical protein